MTPKLPTDVNSASVQPLDVMTSLIDAVNALSLDTSFKNASALVNEMRSLHEQVRSKDEEIDKLNTSKETAYNEMFEANQKERNKHTEVLNQVDTLKATIQGKEDTIATQVSTINNLKQQLQDLTDLYKKEQGTVSRANKDIDGLQENIKRKEADIEALKTTNSKTKKGYKTLEAKAKSLEESKISLEEKLLRDSTALQELQGYVATYCEDKEEDMLEGFLSLWQFASQALVVHFKDNIPAENLQNHQAWKKLKTPYNMLHQVPLPLSNSDPAKQMRLAVFLGIFAREINQQIFQPTYLSLDDNSIREVLVNLAMNDYKKESFCRAMLLSIDPQKQATNLEERKKTVVRNVEFCLKDLFSPTQFQEVRRSLEEVVQRAAETWKYFQRAIEKYEPDFEWEDYEWEPFPFVEDTGATDSLPSASDTEETPLTIFPRIYRVKNNAFVSVGIMTILRRSQCVAADRECRRKESSNHGSPRMASDRRRSRGMSISTGNTTNQQKAFLDNTNHFGDGKSNK